MGQLRVLYGLQALKCKTLGAETQIPRLEENLGAWLFELTITH